MAKDLTKLQRQYNDLIKKLDELNDKRSENSNEYYNSIHFLKKEIDIMGQRLFDKKFKEKFDQLNELILKKYPTIQFKYIYNFKNEYLTDTRWLTLTFNDKRDAVTYQHNFEFDRLFESLDIFYDDLYNKINEYDDFYELLTHLNFKNLMVPKYKFNDDLKVKNFDAIVEFKYRDEVFNTISIPDIIINEVYLDDDNIKKLTNKLQDALYESELFKYVTVDIFCHEIIYDGTLISPNFKYAGLFIIEDNNNMAKLIDLIIKTTDGFFIENNL